MSTLKDKARAQKVAAKAFAKKVRQARNLFALISFTLLVVMPTGVTAWYFYSHAANQYATEFRFAVRGRQDSGGGDLLGTVLGSGSALASASDSYIVVDHMKSLEMTRTLSERLNLIDIYSRPENDPLHRYSGEPAAEEFLDYWEWMIDAEFDISRGIITATVWSFTEEDSLRIANEVLTVTRELVDQLSQEARQEALSYAEEQVATIADELRATRIALQDFRTRENVIDPTAEVVLKNEQIGLLETNIIELTAELETQIATKGEGSASVQERREMIDAQRRQLVKVRDSIDERLPVQAREYESLLADQEIARETYAAALRARHEAEAVATQRQVYLSVYDSPKLAQSSLYPDRPIVIALVFTVLTLVWGIFYVVSLNIRDAAT